VTPGAGAGRLRVALDATPLLGRPTGVGVFCAGLLSGLAGREGLEVSAYAVSWRRRRGIEPLLPAGIRAHQRAMPARPLHRAWRRFDVPPIERFVGPVDVVHGTNFVVPPARRAAEVVTVHDLTPLRFPELCDRATLAFPDMVRRALRRGAWVHTHSTFVAEEVVDAFGADPGRVRAVAPGVPAIARDPAPASRRGGRDGERRHPVPELPPGTTRYILSVGTAEPRKDLPGLVRAFDEVAGDRPGLALVLAGPDGWGSQALASAVDASPFRARILRTGWVDAPALAALTERAAVLAYPSVYEGFGLPPLQAMAAGVAVVASRGGSIPEALGDAATLVDVGDRAALAGALAAVLDQPELRLDLVRRGAARAAQYTWARCAAGLDALYRDAAAGRARR
jgi:glycosyltransferase involved in cell wall biosynthesis